MANLFFKYYWEEEDITFYIQYRDNWPFRQIETSSTFTRFLSKDNPIEGESQLGDQSLTSEDLEKLIPVTEDEFDEIWDQRK